MRKTVLALAIMAAVVLALFAVSYITEFRPEPVMPVREFFGRDANPTRSGRESKPVTQTPGTPLPDTLTVLSWNIGYAGLGDNMDFCVDGGKAVRDSRERTEENLESIIGVLKANPADIYMLQEVDVKAHRTYGIDEVRAISEALPGYLAYFAPNFKVWFVPSPLKEPIGQVHSGLLILTRFRPEAVRRVQYPSAFPFPVSMFNLKRCLLEADFRTSGGRKFHLGDTHCTAFDTGGMRTVENKFLQGRLFSYSRTGESFIVGGDWNQYPPQYAPTRAETENRYFVPELFDTTGMNVYSRLVCDVQGPSMRFNDRPYAEDSTTSVLDFFVVSGGVEPLEMRTLDLGFRNSDHNPVTMTVALR